MFNGRDSPRRAKLMDALRLLLIESLMRFARRAAGR
jgi:hypothetical protein